MKDRPLFRKCDICNKPIVVRTTKYGIPIRNSVRFDIDTGTGCEIETWDLCEECISKVRNYMDDMLLKHNLVKGVIR
jgi:hypothetical protein